MPKIVLENITKRFDKFYAVDNLNLVIEDNAFVTLLGPSGCGKTTTLRMIAGLETPTSGSITIDGVPVFDSERGINIPANKRKVGFLFQNYALWPNMTVYQNIAFGLSNIKEEMPKIDFEAHQADSLLHILPKAKEVKKVLEECRDKKGKFDKKAASIRLIDQYDISEKTAKILIDYRLQDASDCESAAKEKARKLTVKIGEIQNKYKKEGLELNEKFELVKDGKVQTQVRKLTEEEIDLQVRRVSRIVKIGMFMDRYPSELSGGQQQRVAIARTLAPKPKVLFMDEPLSNLDAKLRIEMRSELQRLHIETGSTFIYVTHDQLEAMTLATKICLIENGVLQQYDAPLEVYKRPANLFIADFVGNPSINFIEGKGVQEGNGSVDLTVFDGRKIKFLPEEPVNLREWCKQADADVKVQAEDAAKRHKTEKSNKDSIFQYHISKVNTLEGFEEKEPPQDDDLVVGVRPEFINIDSEGPMDCEIYSAMPTGMETMVRIRIGEYLLTSVMFGGKLYQIGQKMKFTIDTGNVLLFSRKTGRLIARGRLSLAAD
ncbi:MULTISPECIES: ABC transporter ATP-binding protein [Caproicibacterium]|jgi:iron(III) transport system ATP-binding protein|uniref:ATP-binding cassette domain-containing protein n=1 Tax=Caproicibacterium lactatifermentans TaxID=2666138 RepID=A0A859DSG9_9FIRM|nr:ABC transporter ATP-binding protein [Caproicibacterium lactatifermentans]ARP49470.1 ABC transporter ATP-binding protein [Ruminococcaceae bacterium CPB6]MDD4808037.1 ATP-binding cassette domain-containing protein [Oscillospiraceae bacterium]QKN23063.1 ATP-binding cassette domain-containing protein [Caproicibacterium lactatifermentans]QKO30331.1 ATP-binding cassette domain-containing protein [Caproicibacterium lactatifermentans]